MKQTFTILLVPESGSKIRRLVLPGWLLKVSFVFLLSTGILAGIMVIDYWYVLGQASENEQLRFDNRMLRQQVQLFQNRMEALESTVDRIDSFATRLRVITNIGESSTPATPAETGARPDQGFYPSPPTAPSPEPAAPAMPTVQTGAAYAQADSSTSLLDSASTSSGSLEDKLNLAFNRADRIEVNIHDVYQLLADKRSFLAALPTQRPSFGRYTSGFGVRLHPEGGQYKMHEGVDIANVPGTRIKSTADGVVSFAGNKPGYGNTVILDHGYGLETWYAHAREILVRTGQKLKRGTPIAVMGSSGVSTGSHVHYEIRVNNIPVDPLTYILEN